jgi:PAS domain S-box-containing protein
MSREATQRKESESDTFLLSAIVDSSDDAIISKDLNGIITSWNKSAERLFGYAAEEAIGKTVAELLIPDDRQNEEPDILARLRRGERVEHFETVRRRKDGLLLEISLTISPLRDADGRIVGASKIARDISGRKRAERAIQSLNTQLAADLAAMTRIQQVSTRMMQVGDFPQLLEEILGVACEITQADMGSIQLADNGVPKIAAQQGFGLSSLESFGTIAGAEGPWGMALQQGERIIVEDVASSLVFAGTPALAEMLGAGARAFQSTPLVTRGGAALGVLSTYYKARHRPADRDLRLLDILARMTADLIERKRAEALLAQGRETFFELVERAPFGIYVVDANFRIVQMNAGSQNQAFRNVRPIVGHDFGEAMHILWPSEIAEEIIAVFRRTLETGEPYSSPRFTKPRKDVPAVESYEWELHRMVLPDGEYGVICYYFDSTELRNAEAALKSANQDLQQFAFSASHDLQEPLRTIKIYSELLAKRHGDALDSEGNKFMGYLCNAATRMETLIRDLLAYSQLSRFEKTGDRADAKKAIEGALSNLATIISETGAKVNFGPLPFVTMGATHLQQLFQNLIGNAIKYRSLDRPPVVCITAERQSGHWVFSITDNGIGIDPEYQETIFGLFKRLHTTDEYAGTGIGLALCQRIVERYGGRIWVESEPGQGSSFRFTLPV